ncbi:hypothetical protein CFE_2573 [Carboxydocella thermautotrophica]|uniref:Uncharacterized protein n=1 Tax=Carboxydocella thermautotrophica TaxID=178899 RepID=A0A2R4N3L7_CARTR|nr:hypothetical protein CFE_2573 [Carboxydocella thermautotrophica]AVX32127.1 hypothetical protein CTH_2588 [Carboxydocella thermautotrophica]
MKKTAVLKEVEKELKALESLLRKHPPRQARNGGRK